MHPSSSPSPTHPPKSMDVAVLSETIDEILQGIPSLTTTTTTTTDLSPTDTQHLETILTQIQVVVQQNHRQADLLRELKAVVNDLNDLVEELSLSSARQERNTRSSFLKSNPIRNRLKKLIEDLKGLATKLPEIDNLEAIGRQKEKKEIVDQLIPTKTREESNLVPVIIIVGVAGIGKTKLASLVCEDEKVKTQFGSPIRVPRVHTASDVETIRKLVPESPTTNGKGYLVVLDDLRIEVVDQCLQQILTEPVLPLGAILITTRSKLVANKIASSNIVSATTVVLQGLNEDDSWALFRKIRGLRSIQDTERKIVMNCGGVPLRIKFTAWFLNNCGSEIQVQVAELKSIFYDNLPRFQKLCFAYFSLFPRDHLIDTERLIHLWAGEGFVMTTPPMSDDVEEILRGCFNDFLGWPIFKDMEEDECGVVRRCRIQPLMHDLARFVSDQKEDIMVDPDGEKVQEGVLRVSFEFSLDVSGGIPHTLFEKGKKLRTILLWAKTHSLLPKEMKISTSTCDKIFKTFKTLRMLDLHDLGIKTVPNSIGELKNLRYLDLSLNNIEKLPGSITKLSNLQTLKLSHCHLLEELPKNIEDLISLKHLELEGCLALTHMPRKIHKLNSLQTLSLFVVSKDYQMGGLGELASLNNLRGNLEILHLERLKFPSKKDMILKGKKNLQRLTLRWDQEDDREEAKNEKSLDCLEPHSELKVLFIVGYKGGTLSNWLASMQCLVKLSLYDCTSCKVLAQLDQLPKLRILELLRLENLEFIAENGDKQQVVAPFFPSLEELIISDCPELKSWWKTEKKKEDIPFFACISKLHVCYCPKLTCMPLYPGLDKELVVVNSSVKPLQDTIRYGTKKTSFPPFSKLRSMLIASVEEKSPPEEWLRNFISLEDLHIKECNNLKSLPKGFNHLSSLQRLTIENCPKLNLDSSSSEWKGLKNLNFLTIREIPNLKSLPPGLDNVTSLQDLELHNCSELTCLPESIDNIKSLARLVISECNKLASLPKGLKNLKFLDTLIILDCTLLLPRCQPKTGDDWPQIARIKNIQVKETFQDI